MYWVAKDALQLSVAETQTVVFLWLTVVDGQVTIYLTRTRGFFWTKPYPSHWVMVATLLVLGAAVLMAIEGWLTAPLPPSLIAVLLLLAVVRLQRDAWGDSPGIRGDRDSAQCLYSYCGAPGDRQEIDGANPLR